MQISAVVLSKNEEKNIGACLKSLQWCDEIILIDDFSNDFTVEIAKKYGAEVFNKKLENDFSAQRNYGMSKAKGNWILFVDSDERVSQLLQIEIKEKIEKTRSNGFFIKRDDFLFGKKLLYGETGNKSFLRLTRKDMGRWLGAVHETLEVKGSTETLTNPLDHYPHQTLSEFLKEINLYTDIRSKELHALKVKVTFLDVIIYPKVKFFYNFIIRLGFLDGMRGLVVALIMSFHSYLVRAKLWQLNNEKR